jgi:hypothetical protein
LRYCGCCMARSSGRQLHGGKHRSPSLGQCGRPAAAPMAPPVRPHKRSRPASKPLYRMGSQPEGVEPFNTVHRCHPTCACWPGAHKKKAPRAIGCGGRGGLEHELRPLQALPLLACCYGLLRVLKAHTKVCVGCDPSVGLRFLFLRLKPHCCGGRFGTMSARPRYCFRFSCVSLRLVVSIPAMPGPTIARASVSE